MISQRLLTYRIYGRVLETWTTEKEHPDFSDDVYECEVQKEIEFTEYYEDGSICEEGSADFNPESYKRLVAESRIWTWDGKSYNRGGHRKFDYEGNIIRYRRSDQKLVLSHLKRLYPNATLIQLRRGG